MCDFTFWLFPLNVVQKYGGLNTPFGSITPIGSATDIDMKKIGQARNTLMDIKLTQVATCLLTAVVGFAWVLAVPFVQTGRDCFVLFLSAFCSGGVSLLYFLPQFFLFDCCWRLRLRNTLNGFLLRFRSTCFGALFKLNLRLRLQREEGNVDFFPPLVSRNAQYYSIMIKSLLLMLWLMCVASLSCTRQTWT